jgi:hypothetical protein
MQAKTGQGRRGWGGGWREAVRENLPNCKVEQVWPVEGESECLIDQAPRDKEMKQGSTHKPDHAGLLRKGIGFCS